MTKIDGKIWYSEGNFKEMFLMESHQLNKAVRLGKIERKDHKGLVFYRLRT